MLEQNNLSHIAFINLYCNTNKRLIIYINPYVIID